MSFFGVGGNPFNTPIGQKIEHATSENLASEDWALNMEICDLINNTEDGPRDAMKAIRKRLTSQSKNYVIVMYTLTVLEACVKNGGKRIHVLVCSKDFVQELVKLIGPKNEPPTAVQDKVLSLIQSWAETFRHQPELSGVSQVYADLKHKGVEFPTVELEPPILTPQRTVSNSPSSVSPAHRQTDETQFPAETTCLTVEQMEKLRSELDLVESNGKVLSEMLNELTPGKEDAEDLTLLKDLNATCRVMQERVVDLVGRFPDDELTADLLRINDDLNNIFVRYERYISKVKTHTGPEGQLKSPVQPDTPLIDLGNENAGAKPPEHVPNAAMAAMNISTKIEDVDFDAFAQSRKSIDQPSPVLIIDGEAVAEESKPNEFDEMEKWLREEQPTGGDKQKGEESISSSDFDRFLEERASAADTLPPIIPPSGVPPRTRTLAKEDNGKYS